MNQGTSPEKKKKMTVYDLQFIKMLLTDNDIMELFSTATDEKGSLRADGLEFRATKSANGEVMEVEGD